MTFSLTHPPEYSIIICWLAVFPPIFFHLAGCGWLLLFEKTVHPWRHLGKERESHCWGKLQGTKRGIEAEPTFWDQGGTELEVDAVQQHSSNQEQVTRGDEEV